MINHFSEAFSLWSYGALPLVTTLAAAVVSSATASFAQSKAVTKDEAEDAALQPSSDAWEPQIAAFESADAENPPAPGQIVFVGSSSIRGWGTLRIDFPGYVILNRGFGGSQMVDSAYYADRIVIPYKPRLVVLYAGDNDIGAGKTAERIAGDFRRFVEQVRAALPDTHIACISVKPSLARWPAIDEIRRTNALIRSYIEAQNAADKERNAELKLKFIDINPAMLGADGKPRAEFFQGDGLHMTRQGYEAWAEVVRPYLSTE